MVSQTIRESMSSDAPWQVRQGAPQRLAWWWIYPAGALVVLLLHVWFPPLDSGVRHDTYSATPEGQRAFYRLVAAHVPATQRNTLPLNHVLSAVWPENDTLCVLGPSRWPTRSEWQTLLAWVERGGQLLLAFRGDKEQALPELNVRCVPRPQLLPPHDAVRPLTSLVRSPQVAWWTDAHLLAPGAEVLVEQAGEVQAVRVSYGAGRVVIVATPWIFSNQLLAYGDNPLLAYRLLEAAGPPRQVVFDESLNATGTSQALGVLLEPPLRPLTLQLLLLLILYAWWNCQPFGPRELPPETSHQNLVEHTDALGLHYWHAGDGAAMLRSYLRSLRSELRPPSQGQAQQAWLVVTAKRLGWSVQQVAHELQTAQQAANVRSLSRSHAARLITRLAYIRRALSSREEPPYTGA